MIVRQKHFFHYQQFNGLSALKTKHEICRLSHRRQRLLFNDLLPVLHKACFVCHNNELNMLWLLLARSTASASMPPRLRTSKSAPAGGTKGALAKKFNYLLRLKWVMTHLRLLVFVCNGTTVIMKGRCGGGVAALECAIVVSDVIVSGGEIKQTLRRPSLEYINKSFSQTSQGSSTKPALPQ